MDSNELKLIVEISKNRNTTQRELSERTDLSLGMVNLILKRLVRRGYVKSHGLNAKKVEYLLTPKGFSEKLKKSYNYIFKTINLVKIIQAEIRSLIMSEYKKGVKDFVVFGNNTLADQVNLVMSELRLEGLNFRPISKLSDVDREALVLVTDEKVKKVNGNPVLNIAEKLADLYWGVES